MINKRRKMPFGTLWCIVISLFVCSCGNSMETVSESGRLKSMADEAYRMQHYTEAVRLYTDAMDASYADGDSRIYYTSLANIGMVHDVLGDAGRAMVYYRKALAGFKECGYTDFEARILPAMVVCSVNRDNIGDAKMYYAVQSTLAIPDPVQDRYYKMLSSALLQRAANNVPGAMESLERLVDFADSASLDNRMKVPVIMELGHLWKDCDCLDSAIVCYDKALMLAREDSLSTYVSDCYQSLSRVNKDKGNADMAQEYQREYQNLYESISDVENISEALTAFTSTEASHTSRTISRLSHRIGSLWVVITVFGVLLISLCVAIWRIYLIKKSREEAYRVLVDKIRESEARDKENIRLRDCYLNVVEEIGLESSRHSAGAQENENIRTEKLLKCISEVMNNPAFLFDPEFNLSMLCREVGSNTKYVSSAINGTYHKNFRQLLNELRINRAMERLASSDCSIQDLSSELGYGSPNNFILVFKSIIGMPPAAYRRMINSRNANIQQ